MTIRPRPPTPAGAGADSKSPPPATYRLSLLDHEADDFVPEWTGLTKWELRGVIRDALGRGYDTVSYLVEREAGG